ncbi:hypothetical protein ACIA5E_18715 [Nocardia asteroides]|uniref:hypothetical protein n=1 Tax=Nocardia asteroides TaxID=1824 RepID=UPI0037A20D79
MNGINEPNAPQSARQAEPGESAGALAETEIPHAFDCSQSTLVEHFAAMKTAGWLTGVTEPSGELR